MAINKRTGMDLRAINRDQKAIDKLPNKGRATTSHSKALEKAKGGKQDFAKKINSNSLSKKQIARLKASSTGDSNY